MYQCNIMGNLKRSHTLYIQSKHRDAGTTSRYNITLPTFINNDANDEVFKISLVSFCCYNDMLQVKDGCNTVIHNGTEYMLENGTYTFQRLAKALQGLLEVPVVWSVETNTMSFSFDQNNVLRFDGLANILGFDVDTPYIGTTITSVRAMKPYKPSHFMVHLDNIQTIDEHLCLSNHSGEIRISNILAKVLINSAPFQLVTYEQVLESDGLYSADNTLQNLEFVITDNDGNLIEDMVEHEIVLRIESIDLEDASTNEILRELKEVRQTLKDQMLMKALRFRQ